jgi:hypothetical protein
MSDLPTLHAFDVANSEVTVWAFKRSTSQNDKLPIFTGRWIQTSPELGAALRSAVDEARKAITETIEYSLLAQNNEGSALTITTEETYAGLIVEQAADPTPAKKAKKLKEINNSAFYAVKLVVDGAALYAVRKTDDSWRTTKSKNVLSVVYQDDVLALETGTRFNMSKYFDFLLLQDTIFVSNKGSFESLLSYRQAHLDDFSELQKEPEFLEAFSNLDELIAYVGTNKIQLRRASAIRQKAFYKVGDFMDRLRNQYKALGLNIAFDDEGRIVPSAETCRDIFQALLDHRLDSRLSNNLYDVDNTAVVGHS